MLNKNTRHGFTMMILCLTMATAVGASDVLSQLGVPVEVARQEVMAAALGARVNVSVAAAAFKAAPDAVRVQLAQGAVAWAKSYSQSAAFEMEYAELRDARRPAEPSFEGTPEDELQRMLDRQIAEMEKSRAALASMDPDTRTKMEAALGQAAAAMRQLDMPQMRARQLAGIRYTRNASATKYNEALRRWEHDYPQDSSGVIARRLKAFLDVSADVDYAAPLVERDGVLHFVDPSYEKKPAEWKLCYRAGKHAVDAARSAAAAWLKEIES